MLPTSTFSHAVRLCAGAALFALAASRVSASAAEECTANRPADVCFSTRYAVAAVVCHDEARSDERCAKLLHGLQKYIYLMRSGTEYGLAASIIGKRDPEGARDYADALRLYRAIAADKNAPAAIRDKVTQTLAALKELARRRHESAN